MGKDCGFLPCLCTCGTAWLAKCWKLYGLDGPASYSVGLLLISHMSSSEFWMGSKTTITKYEGGKVDFSCGIHITWVKISPECAKFNMKVETTFDSALFAPHYCVAIAGKTKLPWEWESQSPLPLLCVNSTLQLRLENLGSCFSWESSAAISSWTTLKENEKEKKSEKRGQRKAFLQIGTHPCIWCLPACQFSLGVQLVPVSQGNPVRRVEINEIVALCICLFSYENSSPLGKWSVLT